MATMLQIVRNIAKPFVKIIDNFCKMFSTSIMKKRITLGISFPDETILENAKERAKELGIRSFSDYINQLIKYDLGLPNYISQYIARGAKSRAEALIDAHFPALRQRLWNGRKKRGQRE